MKFPQRLCLTVVLLGLLGLLSGCCYPLKSSTLDVNLHPQQRDWWCWAACAEMISEYYGHKIEQCDSANYVYNLDHDPDINCCTGCTGTCPCWGSAWGVYINELTGNWDHWNFTYTYLASTLSWDELKKTLSKMPWCKKCPVEALVPGHVVVVYGYRESGDMRYVYYRDPWEPNCERQPATLICQPKIGGTNVVTTYEAFITRWWGSLYDFNYAGP